MVPNLLAPVENLVYGTRDLVRTVRQHVTKERTRAVVKAHPLATGLTIFTVFMLFGCQFIIPPQGRIVAVGPEIREAFDLLKATPTGKKIISHARKSTRGAPVFLLFGTTEGCSIRDNAGDTVNGLTHVSFKSYLQTYSTDGILVYTNKDITQSDRKLMALVLAFELENVIYSMHFPDIEFGKDSPQAEKSLEQVAAELRGDGYSL
jgi:hypothetical protein